MSEYERDLELDDPRARDRAWERRMGQAAAVQVQNTASVDALHFIEHLIARAHDVFAEACRIHHRAQLVNENLEPEVREAPELKAGPGEDALPPGVLGRLRLLDSIVSRVQNEHGRIGAELADIERKLYGDT